MATETFTTVGTHNWVCPANVSSVQIECWGAGGSGGSSTSPSYGSGRRGGGGGAYSRTNSFAVTSGQSYTYHIGLGGAAQGGGNGNGVAGEATYFNNLSSVAVCKANGGGAGNQVNGVNGGATSGGVGDVLYAGGSSYDLSGFSAVANSAGGSSAGTAANGTDGYQGSAGTPPSGGARGGDSYDGGDPGATGGGGGANGIYDGGYFASGAGGVGKIILTYTVVLPTAATPTFSPVAGSYTGSQTVTISNTTGGCTFRYTTDGSTPTSGYGTLGTLVTITANCTLKAIAYRSGYNDSAVGSAAYVIAAVTPTFSPVAGTYNGNQTVTISSATGGCTFRYTTDGSTPTSSYGTLGSSAAISANCTLKAVAYEAGLADSAVGSAAYTIIKGGNQGGIFG